jgi:hypothetical protein
MSMRRRWSAIWFALVLGNIVGSAALKVPQKVDWPRDFVAAAESARWSRTEKDDGRIAFNDPDPANAAGGVVKYVEQAVLEHDKSYPRVLATRPEPNGVVFGYFDGIVVPSNSQFRAEVGFLKGGNDAKGSDTVTFTVSVLTTNGTAVTPIASVTATYDDRTDVLRADLTPFAGQTVTFRLDVRGSVSAGQEPVWTFARIEPLPRPRV